MMVLATVRHRRAGRMAAALALLAATLAGPGAAAQSLATIEQIETVSAQASIIQKGAKDSASISQRGGTQVAAISQTGDSDSVSLAQDGPAANRASIDQAGGGNVVTATQSGLDGGSTLLVAIDGLNNRATITQTAVAGEANLIDLTQHGDGNHATLAQAGAGDQLRLVQQGNANAATLSQHGNGLSIDLKQNGNQSVTIAQTSRGP